VSESGDTAAEGKAAAKDAEVDAPEGIDVSTAAIASSPDVLVDSLGQYFAVWWQRLRGGESGALPIVAGLIVIVVIFQTQQSKFLSAVNLVNLLQQAAFFILLGMAEMFALILSEIDLSVGFNAAIGGTVIAALATSPYNWPWWAAVIVGLLASAFLGAVQGTIITRLHLPSFVVTLAGLLGFSGLLIYIFDIDSGAVGGVISVSNNSVISNLVNGNLSPTASWIVLAVSVAIFGAVSIIRTARRRSQGLSAPPMSITILTIAVVAAAGIALVVVCNINRGSLVPLQGVPWVVLLVMAVVMMWSWLLGKTRTGRYIYAIGGSPEAARRAGVNVPIIRTIAFTLSGFTAGIAGLVYASRLGSISVGFDGGTYVLYAVAAAVIGGASLFGGRGKAVHALLGGIVIAAVYNGLALLGISTAGTEMATALVLLAAVSIDSLVRRRGTSTV
jgi:D-xylose transport system permease protein